MSHKHSPNHGLPTNLRMSSAYKPHGVIKNDPIKHSACIAMALPAATHAQMVLK